MTKVFVATSGGVDSSVALALLHEQGYDVTGVYFKTYKPDVNEQESREHCRQQGLDAQAVCEHLGVPFRVFGLEEEYRQKVFDYMIAGYKAGITPNPDIMCNKEIKFGIFAKRAFDMGADYIATGHYARVKQDDEQQDSKQPGLAWLLKGVDDGKDQSYFLSQISQEVLAKTIFPLGELCKSEVRGLAKKFGLHTAGKKDSQGICFIGQEMNVKDFLKKYIPEQPGNVLSISGEVIGSHNGARLSTIGERHGFTMLPVCQTPEMPRMFIISRDIAANIITVGTAEELEQEQRGKASLLITNVSWIGESPQEGKEYECRIRHRGELSKCTLTKQDTSGQRGSLTNWQVGFATMPYAPAPGQYLAVYDGDRCLGGGALL